MQLGGRPPDLYRQVVQGISDITFTLPGYTSGDFPMMALTELPGTAESAEDGTRKIWKLFDKYLARDFKDTKVLMLWNSNSASLMSRAKPIRTLEDLKGMRIRTPSAAQSAQLEALGAIPIDMPANQIYNNLDRGVIDASMIPMSAALDFKLIEVVEVFHHRRAARAFAVPGGDEPGPLREVARRSRRRSSTTPPASSSASRARKPTTRRTTKRSRRRRRPVR